MSWFKKILVALVLAVIVLQFFKPGKNTTETIPHTDLLRSASPPAAVGLILKKACYDCHSNNSVYPWYSNFGPVAFWMDHHIQEGKAKLNFSEWDSLPSKKKSHLLSEIIEQLDNDEMPLKSYRWGHPEARLTKAEKDALKNWASNLQVVYHLGNQK